MLKSTTFFTCLFVLNLSFAQQDKQLTHYMFERMSFNPAATGFAGYSGTFIYRNQWDRVQDAPNTSVLNFEAKLPKNNVSIGMSFTNDAIGFQRNNTLTFNGAYHFPTRVGVLSGGVGIGLINVGFSPNWIPPVTLMDPSLPLATSGTAFDLNIGLFWSSSKRPYYIALSTTHLAPQTLATINFSVVRHYYVLTGYTYRLNTSRKIDLKPSFILKTDGATAVFDLNITGDIWMTNYSYLWAGMTYRLQDAIAFNVGYAFSPSQKTTMNMMKIGYSFDVMTNPLNTYGRGTHELMLNFSIFPPPCRVTRTSCPFILQ